MYLDEDFVEKILSVSKIRDEVEPLRGDKEQIYFILNGSVNVYDISMELLNNLKEGDVFKIDQAINTRRRYKVDMEQVIFETKSMVASSNISFKEQPMNMPSLIQLDLKKLA